MKETTERTESHSTRGLSPCAVTQLSIAQLNKNTKTDKYPITQSPISQLPIYNFELPVRHLSWTHNLVLIQRVKDIRARYWYMVQCIKSNWKVDYLKEVITRDDYGKHGALAKIILKKMS